MTMLSTANSRGNLVPAPIEQDFETSECVKFLYCIRKSLKIFYLEKIFIGELFDPNQKIIMQKILERIIEPVLRFLKEEAEKLAVNMKLITSKLTSKYVISMFSVLENMVRMKPEFIKVFEELYPSNSVTSRNINRAIEYFLDVFIVIERAVRFFNFIKRLVEASFFEWINYKFEFFFHICKNFFKCATTLKDIIEEIKNDPPIVQPNGNIHPITTDVITFVKNLLPFDQIAGLISNVVGGENKQQLLPCEVEISLRREVSGSSRFNQVAYSASQTDSETHNYRIALSEYFFKLFRWLNLNLRTKSENYENPNLKWIFLLNNAYKISKLFSDASSQSSLQRKQQKTSSKCQSLDELFQVTGKRDLKLFYDNEILNFKREYSKCWSKLLSYIRDLNEANPFTEAKMKDKERQLLKDRFSGFNKEFEEIYESQKKFYIPSEQAELAEILRQDNIIYIISQYKRFYETYAKINFATNREKYVKYTPDELTAMMRGFFSAN